MTLLLTLLWTFEGGWLVSSLAPGPLLGVATYANCFYLLNWTTGEAVLKRCPGGQFERSSYAFGKYAFLKDGAVYVTDGKEVKEVKCNCTYALPLSSGLAECWDNGTLTAPGWKANVRCSWLGTNGTALFVVTENSTLIFKMNGTLVSSLPLGGKEGALCGRLLALAGDGRVVLLNGTRPLWVRKALSPGELDFSDDCKYLAYTDIYNGTLTIVDVKSGKVVLEKYFEFSPSCALAVFSVAWKGNIIAVGRGDGWVYAYRTGWER